jgi:hypothetical protein
MAVYTTTYSIDFLNKKEMKTALEKYCFKNDLELKYKDFGGFIRSDIGVKVIGNSEDVENFKEYYAFLVLLNM